jgi:hypothetical protein
MNLNLNVISKDAFFIRLTDKVDCFVHPTKEQGAYVIAKNLEGAAIFTRQNGEEFIKYTGADNLELIPVGKLVKSDSSFN